MLKNKLFLSIAGFVATISIIVAIFFSIPIYLVWQQSLSGKAELAKAEYNKQIRVQEAKAKQEAAEMEAQAEVIRAQGVAKANQIIGESLKNNEEYLRWRFITMLEESGDKGTQIIYIPTEAMMPILEAGRAIKIKEQ